MDASTESASAPPTAGASTPAYPTSQQRRVLWTALTALLAVLLLFGVAALIFLGFITFLGWSYPILLPIGLAVIIALILEPVVDFSERRGMRRRSATLMVCLLAVIGFLLFLGISSAAVDRPDRRIHQVDSLHA